MGEADKTGVNSIMPYTGSYLVVFEEGLGLNSESYVKLLTELKLFRLIDYLHIWNRNPWCRICKGCGKPFTRQGRDHRSKFCKKCRERGRARYMRKYMRERTGKLNPPYI